MPAVAAHATASPQPKVVGYIPSYRSPAAWVSSHDLVKVTHINLAFFNPDSGGNIVTAISDSDIASIISACHANNVKVLFSIGGGGLSSAVISYYQDTVFVDSTSRTTFANTLLSYCTSKGFDGVDVDLEGDIVTAGYGAKYDSFISILDTTMSGYLMTAALSPWASDNMADATLIKFDFINVMAYDATGPWSCPGSTGPHASMVYAQALLSGYESRGVPKASLVMGVPFYGYNFAVNCGAGGITFNEIISAHLYDDPCAAFNDQTGQTYYNGITTIAAKTRYVIENNYGGIMIWELGQDASGGNSRYSLLDTIYMNNYD
ncbi:MAG: hypothetical protein JW969_10655 [Spirochaetales bacterium]|nr:hypothetical protein [Spirochaetales bacterium]